MFACSMNVDLKVGFTFYISTILYFFSFMHLLPFSAISQPAFEHGRANVLQFELRFVYIKRQHLKHDGFFETYYRSVVRNITSFHTGPEVAGKGFYFNSRLGYMVHLFLPSPILALVHFVPLGLQLVGN